MIKIRKKNKKTKGVTLIELLVAIAIFGTFIAAVVGLLISSIQVQRKILATQELLNQASYVIEYVARAIRMATKDVNITSPCLGYQDVNYWVNAEDSTYPTDGTALRLLKSTADGNICQEFYLNNGVLYERVSSDNTANFGGALPLFSNDIEILNFRISVSGDVSGNPPTRESPNLQPRVTIFLELAGKTTSFGRPRVKIQTSISQRNLDIQQ